MPTRVWVTIAPGANYPGRPIHAPVLQFVRRVAVAYGRPLVIGCGTHHNQFVAGSRPPRQSAHWTGDAADIPMLGAALTRLGRTALICAGAGPRWANAQTGGAWTINGVNILFNTHIGGNHFNHLHVGLRSVPPLRGDIPAATDAKNRDAPKPAPKPVKPLPKATMDQAWHRFMNSRYDAPRHARSICNTARDYLKKGVK